MKRKFRLTKSADVKRVRRFGKSLAHPLIVLIMSPNELGQTRFAIAAGRTVGNAVQRNRAKRMIRAALQQSMHTIQPGWDLILLARKPMAEATLIDTRSALNSLFSRAKLAKKQDVS